MRKLFIGVLSVMVAAFLMSSCNKETKDIQPSSFLEIYLTDAPADYKAVWIDIQKVMAHVSGGDSSNQSGWSEVTLMRKGLYNLLNFRNGKDTLLAAVDLPAGRVSQIRLMLGDRNSVVLKDGSQIPLTVPSAQPSGLKLNVHAELKAGISYALVLDFDATQSIVEAGHSGKYILKPVIRTFEKTAGGAIEGMVLPQEAQTQVLAVQNEDTLRTLPDADGSYKFWGLPVGTYKMLFKPGISTRYLEDTINDVEVEEGQATKIDTVYLRTGP